MKKITTFLPFLAFIAYLTKTVVIPATLPDSIVICSLISYIILSQLSLKDKTLEKYDAQLKELKDKLEMQDHLIKTVQGSNNAVKAAMAMRPVMGTKI
jgi:hypothetical protein